VEGGGVGFNLLSLEGKNHGRCGESEGRDGKDGELWEKQNGLEFLESLWGKTPFFGQPWNWQCRWDAQRKIVGWGE